MSSNPELTRRALLGRAATLAGSAALLSAPTARAGTGSSSIVPLPSPEQVRQDFTTMVDSARGSQRHRTTPTTSPGWSRSSRRPGSSCCPAMAM